jgi:hypothetical protein
LKLENWAQIKDDFTDSLLLGNGSSIALHKHLSYSSLYKQACDNSLLNPKIQSLFDYFHTDNFEVLLRLLLHAKLINKSLDIKESKTSEAYKQIKNTLVKTIADVHPLHQDVSSHLLKMADFMKNFSRVFSLNYDLLVYWSMLTGNDHYGQWFKDGFTGDDGSFDEDYKRLFQPYGEVKGATFVFYPHGSLFIATDLFGNELKVSSTEDKYLINTILSQWGDGNHNDNLIPLFVSEGKSLEKLQRIRRSGYLNRVYENELSNLSESLVVYGWSLDKQDKHILDALAKANLQSIAISIHKGKGDWETKCKENKTKLSKIRTLNKVKLRFFDAESTGCWIY